VAHSIRQKLKEQPNITFNAADKKHLLESVKGLSLENSQKLICQSLDLEVKEFEKRKMQSDESLRLELTLTKEQHEMLKKVKSLISHTNPSASVADVFEYLAKDYLKRKDPARKLHNKHNTSHINNKKTPGSERNSVSESGYKSESVSIPTSATEVNLRQYRYVNNNTEHCKQNSNKRRKAISASVKRAVWQRDLGKCQHKNVLTGHLCGSQHLLEFDHIKRVRHGGVDNAENLRLMCKAHNLWRG
jgi:5-methylcytosine-specific restriction endonuclease McrA